MSKVVITGNASGTGDFTIAAPNSNTDRTLTLPDDTGTLLTSASSLAAGNLSGALPAIDGSALTGVDSLPTQTGKAQNILTTDGTNASWLDNHEATQIFGTVLTANTVNGTFYGTGTYNLSESMNNFRGLLILGSNWGNIWYYPVAALNNTIKMYSDTVTTAGAKHMLASYDTYHFYITRVTDTSFSVQGGVGNGVGQIWGIK
tara:strand:+ start:2863 stop:3471 length:609 start_codon:yes stop_codon:yes gene_type:complete